MVPEDGEEEFPWIMWRDNEGWPSRWCIPCQAFLNDGEEEFHGTGHAGKLSIKHRKAMYWIVGSLEHCRAQKQHLVATGFGRLTRDL